MNLRILAMAAATLAAGTAANAGTLDIIKEHSSRRQIVTVPATGIPHNIDSVAMPMTVTVGGATVFILDVAQAYKF